FVFLLAAIALTAWACRRLLSEPAGSLSYACGVAAVFGLVSQVVHSFFDFGLYVPANMALFALMMGSLCGLAARLQLPGLVRNPSNHSVAFGARRLISALAHWPARWLIVPLSKTSAAIAASLLAVATGLACFETSRAALIEE